MYEQNQIRRTLYSAEGQARLSSVLDPGDSRAMAARRVCEAFGFHDARGRLQQASCTTVLRELDGAGLIKLQPPSNRGGGGRPRGLGHAVPLPTGVPDRAGCGASAGSGGNGGPTPPVDRVGCARASSGSGVPCRSPTALPDRFGAWLAGRGRVRRAGTTSCGAGCPVGTGRRGSGICTAFSA